MTTTSIERPEEVENRNRATPEERRSTVVGWVLIALGLFVIFAFAFGAEGDADATFNLSLQTDRFKDLAWTVNA
ncbi:MAG TPA: hypothetical protein VHM29_00775, partial [Acidimicrobiia bacterium]|nr:hypothetical protein [Acidimicrobiia bacterium]